MFKPLHDIAKSVLPTIFYERKTVENLHLKQIFDFLFLRLLEYAHAFFNGKQHECNIYTNQYNNMS